MTPSSTRYPIKSVFSAHNYKKHKNAEKGFGIWAQEEATLKVSTSVYVRLYLCLTVLYPPPPPPPHRPTPQFIATHISINALLSFKYTTLLQLSFLYLHSYMSEYTHSFPSNIPLSTNSLSYRKVYRRMKQESVGVGGGGVFGLVTTSCHRSRRERC